MLIRQVICGKLLSASCTLTGGFDNQDIAVIRIRHNVPRRFQFLIKFAFVINGLAPAAKDAICAMVNHVMSLIAEKYQNVREGVEHIMRGKILEYEAKTILNKGIQIGFDKGRAEGHAEGRAEGFDEGRAEERKKALAEKEEDAREMIRNRMDLSLVEKYTHLPMPRIRELASGLGML